MEGEEESQVLSRDSEAEQAGSAPLAAWPVAQAEAEALEGWAKSMAF